jgi:SAM-dependent methyltransferase
MRTDTVKHPVFARGYARLSPLMDASGEAKYRDELLDGLAGRIIEVGAGNGLNFSHHPEAVSEVLAVEPEAYLRARAIEAASRVTVVDGTADALPAEDPSFDAAVASLVWPLIFGGCPVARDTASAIEAAGFVIEQQRRFRTASATSSASLEGPDRRGPLTSRAA